MTTLIFKAEELEQQGVPYRGAIKIRVQGRQFRKGESYSIRMRSAAVARCQQSQDGGVECLLVEADSVITVWREVPPSPSTRLADPVQP
jgi:hypothetical protein